MSDPELLGWVDERVTATGLRRTGPLATFRERSWACVYTVPTDGGTVWLKIAAPATAAEVGLYELLAHVAPDCVLAPLGVDEPGRRLLLPDAGPSLRDQLSGEALVTAMCVALRRYAALQQQLAPRLGDLLTAGVADMRPAVLPERFDAALEAATPYATANGGAAELRRLQELRPAYVEWCAELAAAGIGPSLDHNDLHAANVGGSADAPRFYDWGDSVVAHPFTSLLTVYDTFPAGAHRQLRDAYLAGFGEPAALYSTAALACRVGNVVRALVWARALGAGDTDPRFADAPFAYLRRLLEP
jgi:hypothetical protein